jgi:hypothetical protein
MDMSSATAMVPRETQSPLRGSRFAEEDIDPEGGQGKQRDDISVSDQRSTLSAVGGVDLHRARVRVQTQEDGQGDGRLRGREDDDEDREICPPITWERKCAKAPKLMFAAFRMSSTPMSTATPFCRVITV